MQEFENIFKKSGGSWENFRIGDLFDIGTGSLLSANELVDGRIKRVSAKSDNNGLIGMYDTYGNNKARHFENFISVNFFGDVFYHPYLASVEMKVHTLKLKGRSFTNKTGLYIASVIRKTLANKFGYGNQLSSSKLKDLDFKIILPIKDGKICFEYMEKYIEEIEVLRIKEIETLQRKEIEAYLMITGLKEYKLTIEDKKTLDKFNEIRHNRYRQTDRQTDRHLLIAS